MVGDERTGWRRSRTLRHAPVLLVLVSFGVLYAHTLASYGMFMWDEAEYATIGRSVLRGEGFSIAGRPDSLRPPVLPLAGAASMWLAGDTRDVTVKRANVGFALLALALVYGLATVACDPLAGLIASVSLGAFPAFWLATPQFLSETPFLAFFVGAVLCFEFGLTRDRRWFYASWACWGLAFLTRYTAVLFAPLALLLVALNLRGRPWRSRHFWIAPLAGLLLYAPWLARQQLTFGDALVGIRQSSQQLLVYLPGVSMPWYFYFEHLPEMLSPALLVVVALAAARLVWLRDRFGLHILSVVGFVLLWFSVYRYKETRLITSTLPFLAVLAGCGVRRWLPSRPHPVLRGAVAIGLVVLVWQGRVQTAAVLDRVVTLGYPSFLEAMAFLREHSTDADRVIGAPVPQIAWYADRSVRSYPEEAEFGRSVAESDWVVVTNFERGQPAYASALAKRLTQADLQSGSAFLFNDKRFATVVLRSQSLRSGRR